jgi:putative tryptophan/tyrosine transport system substrate-binding protein
LRDSTALTEKPDAIFVYPDFIAAKHRRTILEFISTHHLPSMF